MSRFYITALEVYSDGNDLRAAIRAEDVCWHVELRDQIHTPESWAELAADISRAMQHAYDHNEAQDRAAPHPAALVPPFRLEPDHDSANHLPHRDCRRPAEGAG